MTKQAFRLDAYGRTWLATNPSPALVVKYVRDSARQGWTLELCEYGLNPRTVGAA